MLQEILEPAWVDAFEAVLAAARCAPATRWPCSAKARAAPCWLQLARLAAARMGCKSFAIQVPTLFEGAGPPVRSTGASHGAAANGARRRPPWPRSTLVVDCTVEGLMHAPELPAILGGGARVIYVSNEHPEALAGCCPTIALEPLVKDHVKRLRSARSMRVTSAAGTDLDDHAGRRHLRRQLGLHHAAGHHDALARRPGAGVSRRQQRQRHAGAGRRRRQPHFQALHRAPDHACASRTTTSRRIEGKGVDADLMRSYIAAWGDREAYAVSHVGYGLNAAARWDSMALYDKRDFNGTELRAFAGNFLYSTGANEVAGRYTRGPLRPAAAQLHGASSTASPWSTPARWWHEPARRSPCWAAGPRC